ncbi:MAG TPA: SdrD B-like domain-containing protein [Anaerolineae bacterium]|nr:SdrD B-like domain-containing protein [Anaerolineae bacterium]
MTDSSRPHNRYSHSLAAARSLVASLAIALSALIVLGGLLTAAQPVGALAAPLSQVPARTGSAASLTGVGRGEGRVSAPPFSPPAAPLLQASTSLAIAIHSTPFATIDSNDPISSPVVWAVEAIITNTGPTTATAPVVDLDMNPTASWFLLPGESPLRNLPPLASGSSQAVYWFARRSNSPDDPHTYTITAWASNANTVTQQLNAYDPFSPTVQTRAALNTGNNGIVSVGANVQVGAAFTMSVDYDMGTNARGVTVQPVGNSSFDPASYRLLGNEVQFSDGTNPVGPIYRDRLYFPQGSLPAGARRVRTTYTFVALRPANVTLCPYTDVRYNTQNKFDNGFCAGNAAVPITGTLSFSFTKSVNAATVRQGELLTYTLRYTNTGDLPISNVYVWDNIPTQTITSSVSPAADGFSTPDRVVWNIGTIGQSGTPTSIGEVMLTVLVNGRGSELLDGTSLVNNGHMGILFNPSAVNPAVTSTVTTLVEAPTVAISKSDDQDTVIQGQVLTYTLRITNTGQDAATNMVITDVLPAGVTYLGTASPAPGGPPGQILTWTLASLTGNGGVFTITVPVSVNFKLADGTHLTNTMQVRHSNPQGFPFSPQSTVDVDTVQSPVLSIAKYDSPDPVISGRLLTYTLLVTNSGPAAATTVMITDSVPVSTTYVSGSCSGGSACGLGDGVVAWVVASIAPSSTAAVTFTVQVTTGLVSGATIVNQNYGVLSTQTNYLAGPPETTTVFNAAAIVTGRAYDDANGNGVPDGGEAGIPGVTVTLPGALQPVTVTNASGQYTFRLEQAGPISVSAELPTPPPDYFRTTPSPVFLDVTLEATTTVDFGYAPVTSTIGVIFGTVFEDADADGVQDLGEAGLSGVSVASSGASNTPATTNAFGQYALTFSSAGTYTVAETNPANYVSTTPDSVVRSVSLAGSSQVDFGDFLGVRIEGQVFDDANVNGANDSEPGVSGAVVTAGSDSMMTGATGVYTLFVTVQSGQPITLTETDPAGYVSTAAIPGSAAVVQIDANTLRLNSPISGTVYTGNDFGDVLLSADVVTITGQIFEDANADGVYNDGGAGLANGRVSASSGMFVTTTATGDFTLYGPANAVITVTETNPPGYVSTNAIPGNAAAKLDIDTLLVGPLTAGALSAGNYFGDVLPSNAAVITGTLFNDADNDGVFDPGESTFSGVQVTISGTTSLITTTNAAGTYFFAVGAGTFVIRSGVPAGFYRTTPEQIVITTTLGSTYPNRNFGFSNNAGAATIYGTVFNDLDGDGLQDLGELGLAGATLRLITGTTSVATATTGIDGAYTFSVNQPGVWAVEETNPPGYYSTSSDRLNVSVALGESYQINFGDSNRQNVGSVHGVVFDDANANGVQDTGEVGISGVVITTTADDAVTIISATTGIAGQYTYGFDFVSHGTHTIHEVNPPGYRSTTPDAVVVNVSPGEPQVVDFGDCQIGVCASVIHGIVFDDANGDGNQDFAELGLTGVTVTLYSGANPIAVTATGPNGSYTFGNLGNGVYRVVASNPDPLAYHFTTPDEVHVSIVSTGSYIVNFGVSNNPGVSSIFGTVFNDADADSVFDLTEVGIPSVPVRIDGIFSGFPITSVATNAYGHYTFLIDQSGLFTVTETNLPGYASTTPDVVAQVVALNNDYTVNFGDYVLPPCTGDDAYEVQLDDAFGTTAVALTDTTQLHNFFGANDQDWLKVTLKRGDVYTFTTVAFGVRADTVLALYASNGTTRLAYSDDTPGATNFSSRIRWVGTADGTHYLRVTPRTSALAGCDTDYSVSMTVEPRYSLLLPLIMRSYP